MPTTYAHDLFGKMVFQNLNERMQSVILENKMEYIIGLHGPDILFYHRPFHKNHVNELGRKMHSELAVDFFKKGKEKYLETRDPAILSYLLGFICHYMLDSTCHPYIGGYMKKTGASHDEIETELDRTLMEATGKNPFRYQPSGVIQINEKCIREIASLMEGVTEKDIRRSLWGMKFYTSITVCNRPLKRSFLLGMARLIRIYDLVHGRVMRRHHNMKCQESTIELRKLFRLAIPETVTVLEEFFENIEDKQLINARFYRNYE